MNPTIEQSNEYGAISEDQLKIAELFLGVKIPDDYRLFMLEHNGGRPNPSAFDITDDDASIVDQLYGIHNGPNYASLIYALNVFRNRIPDNMIPIGCDPGGNQICIGLRKDRGKVFYWDHEAESEENVSPTYENITLLANTFNEFLSILKVLDQGTA